MIVRDEEQTLARCLNSVRPIADELVIVDTGSADNTVSVARDFGAKICHFEWIDDFSAARNVSLGQARSDWILQVDADEELLPESIKVLQEAILNPWCLLYTITVDNGPTYSSRFFHPGRLFRNHPEMRYTRPYHETLRESERRLRQLEPNWQIINEPNIILRHYGYDESYLKEGGKYAREIKILTSYVKDNPDDLDMTIRLAEILICVKQCDEAMDICKKVITTNPDFARAHHALGAAYWKMEQLDEAISELKKTIAIDTDFGFAHYRLGVAYCTKGRFEEAIRELQEAIATEPHFALARCWLGISYCKNGLLEEGIAVLKQAVSMDANLALAHYWLGAVYNKQGFFQEAIAEFTQARTTDPDVDERLPYNLATAHFNLGTVFHSKGMLDEAIREYRCSLDLSPNDSQIHYNMGIAYETKGMVHKAIAEFEQSVAINPLFAQAHHRLAVLHHSREQHGLAIKHCDEAIKLGLNVDSQLIDDLRPFRPE
ncbi:MAG: tetratricopeptide repeat protein [Deltaproteobacteria bacterium]|nr:tetratricopeptide repeat protein [Deltaproteobacteria bacterium]